MPTSTRPLVLALSLSVLAVPKIAFAGDPAAAQALFDEAKQLMAQGKYALACPKLQESQSLDPGLGTQFHLADCLQHVGHNASAWALFREVESQAHALGQEGRVRVAHDRASALEPFLSKIVIDTQSAASNPLIEVRRDGAVVDRSQWGVPVPVDPGTHLVKLTAPNKRPWETSVEVIPDGRVVRVDLPSLSDLPDVAASAPPVPAGQPTRSPSESRRPMRGVTQAMPPGEETPEVENRGGFQRAVGWFFVGGGVVGLGAAAYFGAQWANDHSRQTTHCGNGCDAIGIAARDSARKEASLAEATAGAGGAALLVGTVLVLTAPGPRLVVNNTATIELTPTAGVGGGGLLVHGTW